MWWEEQTKTQVAIAKEAKVTRKKWDRTILSQFVVY
jgi:hypothetical protein